MEFIKSGSSSKSKLTESGVNRLLENYLNSFEQEYSVETVDPRRYFYLRPSSFPYCGFRRLLQTPDTIEGERLVEFASSYFTTVGHAVHAVFQKYAAAGMKVVGNWYCKTCKIENKFSCESICKKCNRKMHYNELEIIYKGLVVGHTDGLFRLEPSKGRKSGHILFDYKTTGMKKVTLHKQTRKVFPYKPNVSQIESYIPLLEIQYKTTVNAWALIYLARDAPFRYGRIIVSKIMTTESKEKILKRIKSWIRTHKLVLTAESKVDFQAIEKRKLCKDMEDYKENVDDQYNPCPLASKCFTKPNALIKEARAIKIWPILDHAPTKIRKDLDTILGVT